ncbi:multiple epidermal growth factor domains protein 6 [Biomphalaria glabrata]|nr:multiple epidermal growth factor domains protein 6 [Biomphalaria glabrata]
MGCKIATCQTGFHGANCTETCSSNCLNQSCNNVNGNCLECPPGKIGNLCDQACPQFKFGKGCTESCSSNCGGDKSCNPADGGCLSPCVDGYQSSTCQKECPPNTFGAGCQSNCSQYCKTEPDPASTPATMTVSPFKICHNVDGRCLAGCQSGYEGETCLIASPSSNTASAGVIAGPIIAIIILLIVAVIGFLFWKKRKSKTENVFGNGRATHNLEAVRTTGLQSKAPDNSRGQKKKPTYIIDPMPSPGDVTYPNRTDNGNKTSIQATDLKEYVRTHNKTFFEEQFKKIPANASATTCDGLSIENKHKNRYKNIIAYDHSRVHLKTNVDKNQGDYINASFIKSYKNDEKFIASQGPNKLIIADFVRLLWEYKVDKVVMLTNLMEEGKQKCEQYWPDDHEVEIGEFKVKLKSTDTLADFVIRKLEISKPGESSHFCTQFHFTCWPDKGVPPTSWSLVDFEQRVSLFPTQSPVVVHCSAGVGRSGTFIALHNLIGQAKETGCMDFYNTVVKLRQDRVNMVQTVEQYMFLHEAALVAVICLDTTVHASGIQDKLRHLESKTSSGQTFFEKEFKAVCDICADSRDTTDDEGSGGSIFSLYINSKSAGNKVKNRFSNILPKDKCRPFLQIELKDQGDYINAVTVPSFTKSKDQFITQLPLPTTVNDFWRLVSQNSATLIIAFELDMKDNDTTIGSYLPASKSEPLHCGSVDIRSGPVTKCSCWDEQTLYLTIIKKKKPKAQSSIANIEEQTVTHLQFKGTVINTQKLLEFILYSRSHISRKTGRVVYTCRNGADFSGLACVLSLLLDRMDHDHSITVPLVVGAIKSIRPQVIPTLEQYKTVYSLLKLYSESDRVYYNLGSTLKKGKINPAYEPTDKEDTNIYVNSRV